LILSCLDRAEKPLRDKWGGWMHSEPFHGIKECLPKSTLWLAEAAIKEEASLKKLAAGFDRLICLTASGIVFKSGPLTQY
jgi:hypothetical protein